MGIDLNFRTRAWRVVLCGLALGCFVACAQAQKAPADAVAQWFDGRQWQAVTASRGPQQAAGGVVVMAAATDAPALLAALNSRGLRPRSLSVAGAFELPTAAGADALRLTERLTGLPVPVSIAPNWRANLQLR